MEKINTKEEYNIKQRIESVLHKCALEFKEIDLGDNDLNYSIIFDASDLVSGIGNISAIIYFTLDKPKCTLMLGNIFKFKEKNEDKSLKIANSINKKLNTGRVIVAEPKQLVFLDGRVLEDYNKIDKELIESMIMSAKVAVAVIYANVEDALNEK